MAFDMKAHPALVNAPETSCESRSAAADPGNFVLNPIDGLAFAASASIA